MLQTSIPPRDPLAREESAVGRDADRGCGSWKYTRKHVDAPYLLETCSQLERTFSFQMGLILGTRNHKEGEEGEDREGDGYGRVKILTFRQE
jgi:hypothetical protein